MTALELRGVSKRFGTGQGEQVTAADDVTFTIEAGAFIALTGASGSGKSTLLHMIGAIERPDSGVIISNGTDVTALRGAAQADYRRTVGFVFQRYNLLPGLTVLDKVIAPVLPYRTGWDKRQRARELLAAVGLSGRERSLPSRMSGGDRDPGPARPTAGRARLIRLRDGAVIDDIQLTDHDTAADIIRHISQLG